MKSGDIWPDWLDQARVPDSCFADAYEQTPASMRALLKSAIALAQFHFGAQPDLQAGRIENRHLGYWQEVIKQPVDWACLFFDGAERAAAPVCAAAILPVLANVGQIFAICCAKPASKLLLSLELCGIEDLFLIEQGQCEPLIAELCSQGDGTGRICALNCDFLLSAFERCQNTDVLKVNLKSPQRLLLKSPAAFHPEELEFCLGRVPATKMDGPVECIYAAKPEEDKQEARLKIAPGCEGLWLFQAPGLEFYQQHSFSFGATGSEYGTI